MKKASGYIRVSSKIQVEKGESLNNQQREIEAFIKKQDWNLCKIYSDEGISGGSIDQRFGFKELMRDASEGLFDVLVIHRLSRFARNARDLLNNVEILKRTGVKFVSIKENIDLSNPYGVMMLQMMGAFAQLEREIIREQMHENRVARAKKKIPTSGRLPIARKYDRSTGEWSIDEEKAELLRWAAKEYIKGGSLKTIVHELREKYQLPISLPHAHNILANKCGDTWEINFKSEPKPITFKIPPILDQETIAKVRQRIEFNRTSKRGGKKNRYLLTGYIRCDKCGMALIGQTQTHKKRKRNNRYQYYRHVDGKYRKCRAFSSIKITKIEHAVFTTIFENVADEAGFKKALNESLPSTDKINRLKMKIQNNKKKISVIEKQIEKLVEAVLKGTLQSETVANKEKMLLGEKERLRVENEDTERRLASFPDPELIKRESEMIRVALLDHFSSTDRLAEMTFDEKRQMLHWLFDGIDEDGRPFGIYIKRLGNDMWDYYITARFFCGVKTLKGNDPDFPYVPDDGVNFHNNHNNRRSH